MKTHQPACSISHEVAELSVEKKSAEEKERTNVAVRRSVEIP